MSFTRTCVDCGATLTYKNKTTFATACKRTDEPRCNSCRAKHKYANPDSGYHKPGYEARRRQGLRKLWADPNSAYNQREFRDKLSQNMKNAWQDPSNVHNSPARSEKITAALRRTWDNPDSVYNQPEYRQLRSEQAKQRYADRGELFNAPINPAKYDAKRWKNQVKERDNWTCQECGAQDNLHAHHIKHVFSHPELADDINNGITLCVVCHAKRHPHVALLQEQAKQAQTQLAGWASAATQKG